MLLLEIKTQVLTIALNYEKFKIITQDNYQTWILC